MNAPANIDTTAEAAGQPHLLLRRRVARAEVRPRGGHDQSRHRRIARQGGRRGRGGRGCGGRRREGRLQGMAQRAAARARQDAAPHRRGAARARAGARHDRCRRLRQSGARDGERRDDRRRADRVLRRPRHRDEGRLDPDGPGRGEFLGARAARRRRRASSRSITRSCSAPASPRRRSRPATPWW